jgi:hypothetical protein
MMISRRTLVFSTLFALMLPLCADASEKKNVTRTYPVARHGDVDVDVRVGEARIESFRIKGWPDREQREKAEKDRDDTHSIDVIFTYTNRDRDNDYKCHYTVRLLRKDGKVLGEGDSGRTLGSGKKHDTNKVSLRMKTHRYEDVKTIEVNYAMVEKD